MIDVLFAALLGASLCLSLLTLLGQTIALNHRVIVLTLAETALIDLEGRQRLVMYRGGEATLPVGPLCQDVSSQWLGQWCAVTGAALAPLGTEWQVCSMTLDPAVNEVMWRQASDCSDLAALSLRRQWRVPSADTAL